MDAISHYSFVFHPPALPEDTLMEVEMNTDKTLNTISAKEHAVQPVSIFI